MSASADSIVFNADNADNIEPLHQQCGELSPRSTGSYSSRDSRERFIRPTPERAMKILQRLIHDKMHDVYEIPEVFDKHIRTVIEKFCVVSLEAQGTLEALSEDNIHVFMQAMEENRDPNIMKPKQNGGMKPQQQYIMKPKQMTCCKEEQRMGLKPAQEEVFHLEIEPDGHQEVLPVHSSSVETVSSLSFALSAGLSPEIVSDTDMQPRTSGQSTSSLSSIVSKDSDRTKSIKRSKFGRRISNSEARGRLRRASCGGLRTYRQTAWKRKGSMSSRNTCWRTTLQHSRRP